MDLTPDAMNAIFEFGGALAVLPSILSILKSKQSQGIAVSTALFFTSWGLWNLFYYPFLDQPLSTLGAMVLSAVNIVWLFLILKYKGNSRAIKSQAA